MNLNYDYTSYYTEPRASESTYFIYLAKVRDLDVLDASARVLGLR